MDKVLPGNGSGRPVVGEEVMNRLTRLSCPEDGACLVGSEWAWTSPRSHEDRTITCPNVRTQHCPDLWVPDLLVILLAYVLPVVTISLWNIDGI